MGRIASAVLLLFVFGCADPGSAPAQSSPSSEQTFSQAQLEQMLAPIALYPDTLLTQVLVASTYPLEVVMAEQWLQQPDHAGLQGSALDQALANENWDPSIKSLIPFPTVLKQMDDNLSWTQQLGDAFLAQRQQVFAAVQSLRAQAMQAGKLASTAQQNVSVENAATGAVQYTVASPNTNYTPTPGQAIVIAPANPQVVYVPVYNPAIVYGAWPFPAYPPVYYPPPPGYAVGSALLSGMAFGAGVAITGSLWGWGSCNWGTGNVNVNVNQWNNINRNFTQISANQTNWRFNSEHRRGVAYNSTNLTNRYDPYRNNTRWNGNNTSWDHNNYRGWGEHPEIGEDSNLQRQSRSPQPSASWRNARNDWANRFHGAAYRGLDRPDAARSWSRRGNEDLARADQYRNFDRDRGFDRFGGFRRTDNFAHAGGGWRRF
jgi:hypothetical protein